MEEKSETGGSVFSDGAGGIAEAAGVGGGSVLFCFRYRTHARMSSGPSALVKRGAYRVQLEPTCKHLNDRIIHLNHPVTLRCKQIILNPLEEQIERTKSVFISHATGPK